MAERVKPSYSYLARELKKARAKLRDAKRLLKIEGQTSLSYWELWREAQKRLDAIDAETDRIEAIELVADIGRIAEVGMYVFERERGLKPKGGAHG